MLNISVSSAGANISRHLKGLQKAQIAATVSAINATATQVKNRGAREVAQAVKLPVKPVKSKIMFNRRRDGANKRRLQANLRFYFRPVTASALNPRQTSTGVSARGGHKWPGAFIAKPAKGKPQVFRRQGESRYPLDVMRIDLTPRGPLIMRKVVERDTVRIFKKKFEHELKWRLRRGTR